MHALSASDGGISIAAGIVVGLLASCVQSLGLTIQRKSHVLNQALPDHLQRVEHRRPLWLLGFLIFISSNILGSVFQIASLPVVILAPLGAVSLLWNAFFAFFILGDVFSLWMILGTFLIAGGAVLIAIFGIVPEPNHSIEDLLVLFCRPAFVAYFILLGFAVLVCLAITHLAEYSYSRRLPSRPPSPLLIRTDSVTDLTTERTPLLDRKRAPASSAASTVSVTSSTLQKNVPPSPMALLLSISYASTSGILSGMCLVFAKAGVELLLISIHGNNQFWQWQAWMLVLGLVVFALLQLWYLHKALKLADPTIVCPLAFCFYNISSIVNGLVYFDQVSLLPASHLPPRHFNVGPWSCENDVEASSLTEDGAATDEGSLPAFNPSPAPPPRPQTLEHEHIRSRSETATLSPPHSPLSPRRRTHPLHSGQVSYGGTMPVSSPPSSVPAPVFSIGLSPASPGFVLLPRDRRRGVSGQTVGTSWDDAIRRVRTRRIVSDGVLSGPGVAVGRDVQEAGAGENERTGLARGRWKWLRGLIVGGRREGS
ncbi:hypothetical protein F5148DRAFT_1373089 [Russula earlei]|uniref:Uncharacterized protein n=1 Tax=Russula earlei TaxID=71964 RepID=A0ACC0ULR7_9AGAM|nr:hypothetical protein F5148DRAFT_1373089 [Russula earlei]